MKRIWLLFSQAVTVGVAFWFVLATFQPHLVRQLVPTGMDWTPENSTSPSGSASTTDLPQPSAGSLSAAALKAQPSVVSINTLQKQGSRPFPWGSQEEGGEGLGSGVIISKDGLILTNHHVVEGADAIEVVLHDGQSTDAEVIGTDPETDLALLRVKLPNLPAITLGDEKRTRVGDVVLAIGNPFGVGQTVTSGIISALGRNQLGINTFENFIQTDAAINPGNSGGPLMNSHGEVIGINTAIASRTGQNSGIGFAIPSNLVARIVPELIQHGRFIRPEFGIDEVAKTDEGLRIITMNPAGPAAKAGLRGPEIRRSRRGIFTFESRDIGTADIIVGVNGKKTIKPDEFLSEVESHRPGDRITIEVLRSGELVSVPVLLE